MSEHVSMPAGDDSIFNDDYLRAMKQYKEIYEAKSDVKIVNNDQAVSVILNDSPDKNAFVPVSAIKNNVILPRETVYMIDKVVRQRASRARLFRDDSDPERSENTG